MGRALEGLIDFETLEQSRNMADDPQLPLLGVIMCCTSIPSEQRSDMASIAEQMGAAHKFDLTSDVTHLIVGDTDTPKYKFVAKERSDVKVLLPTWIEAVRRLWMQGGETDVGALELEYRLPTFTGLRVCVTGFEDLSYRKQLEDTINANGGEYRGNLTKDVTHLIAKEPSGQKYSYARQWEIKVVAVEWLEQSLERGMILDEGLYDPQLPIPDRGRGAWARRSVSTSLGRRAREKLLGPQNPRKLRRTASTKLNSQNDGLWTDIVGGETKQEEKNTDEWAHDDRESTEKENAEKAADDKREVEKEPGIYKRNESTVELGSSVLSNTAQQGGIFRGKSFMPHGFDEKQQSILEGHLKSHGASIVPSLPELPPFPSTLHSDGGYIIAPHNISIRSFRDSLHTPQPIVTELWVERCLIRKQLELPETRITNMAFRQFPIPGFEKLRICSTAFQGIDLVHLTRAVKVLGSEYDEFFDSNTSVLVCNSITPSLDKLRHAQLWGTPVVSANWLWECIGNGELLPFETFLVQPVAATTAPGTDRQRLGESTSARRSDTKDVSKARTKKFSKTSASLDESYKHLRKETPKMKSAKSASNTFPDDAGPAQILPDDDNLELTNETSANVHVGNGPLKNHTRSNLEPLREISSNSSPPEPPLPPTTDPQPSTSPTKAPPSHNMPPSDEHSPDTLGPAISSLLAAHRHSSTDTTTTTTNPPPSAPPPPYRRRRRQLLGRAPSNLSSHSINLSRASSVDTINTDGLGTPLESGPPPRPKPSAVIYDTPDDDQIEPEEALQMTQLGYEDPDVAAWRERVAFKMAGGKVGVKGGGTPAKGKKDVASSASGLGIAKRTRLAVGGR